MEGRSDCRTGRRVQVGQDRKQQVNIRTIRCQFYYARRRATTSQCLPACSRVGASDAADKSYPQSKKS